MKMSLLPVGDKVPGAATFLMEGNAVFQLDVRIIRKEFVFPSKFSDPRLQAHGPQAESPRWTDN